MNKNLFSELAIQNTTSSDELNGQLSPQLQSWFALLGGFTYIERDLRQALREGHNCSLPRFDILTAMMADREGLSMSVLAEKMCVTKGAITGVVKSLMEQGLVTREVLNTDKRVQVVRITKPGECLWQEMFKTYALIVENNLSQLSATEVATITRLLRSVQPAD